MIKTGEGIGYDQYRAAGESGRSGHGSHQDDVLRHDHYGRTECEQNQATQINNPSTHTSHHALHQKRENHRSDTLKEKSGAGYLHT